MYFFGSKWTETNKTHFMCKSKGSEPLKPINLSFPTKTTVVIVDRRKTDNCGQNNFVGQKENYYLFMHLQCC